MPYAKRNKNGEIVALFDKPSQKGLEALANDDPEVMEFLARSHAGSDPTPLAFLQQSDLDLVRVVEDLVELLVEKNLINFTELPPAAQEKLLGRKRAREYLNEPAGLMIDETEIL